MAWLPIAASVLGSLLGYKSSRNAAKSAKSAQDAATAESARQFDILQQQNKPFLDAQTKAVNTLSRLSETTYNPNVIEGQMRTEYGRANSAAGQQADMALTNRGLAGAAVGAKMRSSQSAVESGLKAKTSAADIFMRSIAPILGQNAMGTAMAGAQAASTAAQQRADSATQAAYAKDAALQGILGPLGALVESWAGKDEEARYRQILADTLAQSGVSVPQSGTTISPNSGNLGTGGRNYIPGYTGINNFYSGRR